MGVSHTQDNKRLAKNTVALYLRSMLVLFVGLYTSRVLLQALGVSDFGVYNVVGSIVVFFSFLNAAMTAAAQRFLTFEIGRNNDDETRRVFSASMTSQILMALVLVILMEFIGVWFLNHKLNIPEERLVAANWVFQISIVTFVINMLVVPYSASIVAHEKLTFYAYVSIIEAVLKLAIVTILSYASCDRLVLYAGLISAEVFLMLIINWIYCKKKFTTCKFVLVKDKALYKSLFSYSGWSLLGSATNVATQNGFSFIINIFYGVTVNAAMGIANQVNTALSNFLNSFQSSYRPQIVKSYAQNDDAHFISLITSTSKLSYSLIVVPALLLIFNMPLVLDVWLTTVPEYAVQFCQIILICTLVDATTGPYNAAIMATTRIRNYQVAISISFVLDLVFSYALIKIGIAPYIVLLSRLATRGLLNMFIGWYFLRSLFMFPLKQYIHKCILPILFVSIITIPILLLMYNYMNEWKMLVVSSAFILISYYFLIMYVVLSKSERNYVLGFVKSKFKK